MRRFGVRAIAVAALAAILVAWLPAGTLAQQGPPLADGVPAAKSSLPVPRTKPGIIETYASDCQSKDPELAWATLPRGLREVPLRAMIGQLLVTSYAGNEPSSQGVIAARELLAASRIGGVITFRHNIASGEDIAAINAAFATAHATLPAIVAVDQEGGAVMRVKPSEGAPRTPSAREVAATSLAEAEATYAKMAEALAQLGFTVNFGPVVDLELEPDNPVIARFGRSYGADPATVVAYAKAFIKAHHEHGVATALKHFPGHGSSKADSHDEAIDLTPNWSRVELRPFRELIASSPVDMVMVGHLTLEGVSGPGDQPASLSLTAITTLLRETLCFDGLVITDDLAMDAIEKHYDAAEAAEEMIKAGGDIVLVSLSPANGLELLEAITARLEAAAERSPAFQNAIRYAYGRVVNHKLDLKERRALAGGDRTSLAHAHGASR